MKTTRIVKGAFESIWNTIKDCSRFVLRTPKEQVQVSKLPEITAEKRVTLEEYEAFVTRLASTTSMHSFEAKLGTGGLGLGGEAGEVADIAKKVLFHGMPFDEEVKQKLKKELGDGLWYITFTAVHVCDSSLQEILEMNVEKLQKRYSTGVFTTEEFMKKEKGGKDK